MTSGFVDFRTIKEKIIKTDKVLKLYQLLNEKCAQIKQERDEFQRKSYELEQEALELRSSEKNCVSSLSKLQYQYQQTCKEAQELRKNLETYRAKEALEILKAKEAVSDAICFEKPKRKRRSKKNIDEAKEKAKCDIESDSELVNSNRTQFDELKNENEELRCQINLYVEENKLIYNLKENLLLRDKEIARIKKENKLLEKKMSQQISVKVKQKGRPPKKTKTINKSSDGCETDRRDSLSNKKNVSDSSVISEQDLFISDLSDDSDDELKDAARLLEKQISDENPACSVESMEILEDKVNSEEQSEMLSFGCEINDEDIEVTDILKHECRISRMILISPFSDDEAHLNTSNSNTNVDIKIPRKEVIKLTSKSEINKKIKSENKNEEVVESNNAKMEKHIIKLENTKKNIEVPIISDDIDNLKLKKMENMNQSEKEKKTEFNKLNIRYNLIRQKKERQLQFKNKLKSLQMKNLLNEYKKGKLNKYSQKQEPKNSLPTNISTPEALKLFVQLAGLLNSFNFTNNSNDSLLFSPHKITKTPMVRRKTERLLRRAKKVIKICNKKMEHNENMMKNSSLEDCRSETSSSEVENESLNFSVFKEHLEDVISPIKDANQNSSSDSCYESCPSVLLKKANVPVDDEISSSSYMNNNYKKNSLKNFVSSDISEEYSSTLANDKFIMCAYKNFKDSKKPSTSYKSFIMEHRHGNDGSVVFNDDIQCLNAENLLVNKYGDLLEGNENNLGRCISEKENNDSSGNVTKNICLNESIRNNNVELEDNQCQETVKLTDDQKTKIQEEISSEVTVKNIESASNFNFDEDVNNSITDLSNNESSELNNSLDNVDNKEETTDNKVSNKNISENSLSICNANKINETPTLKKYNTRYSSRKSLNIDNHLSQEKIEKKSIESTLQKFVHKTVKSDKLEITNNLNSKMNNTSKNTVTNKNIPIKKSYNTRYSLKSGNDLIKPDIEYLKEKTEVQNDKKNTVEITKTEPLPELDDAKSSLKILNALSTEKVNSNNYIEQSKFSENLVTSSPKFINASSSTEKINSNNFIEQNKSSENLVTSSLKLLNVLSTEKANRNFIKQNKLSEDLETSSPKCLNVSSTERVKSNNFIEHSTSSEKLVTSNPNFFNVSSSEKINSNNFIKTNSSNEAKFPDNNIQNNVDDIFEDQENLKTTSANYIEEETIQSKNLLLELFENVQENSKTSTSYKRKYEQSMSISEISTPKKKPNENEQLILLNKSENDLEETKNCDYNTTNNPKDLSINNKRTNVKHSDKINIISNIKIKHAFMHENSSPEITINNARCSSDLYDNIKDTSLEKKSLTENLSGLNVQNMSQDSLEDMDSTKLEDTTLLSNELDYICENANIPYSENSFDKITINSCNLSNQLDDLSSENVLLDITDNLSNNESQYSLNSNQINHNASINEETSKIEKLLPIEETVNMEVHLSSTKKRISKLNSSSLKDLRKNDNKIVKKRKLDTNSEITPKKKTLILNETEESNKLHDNTESTKIKSNNCKDIASELAKFNLLNVKTKEIRTGGFKRPNLVKIIPLCPKSPTPEAEPVNMEPVIIPLEKPPAIKFGKAVELFNKLTTYSSEEKVLCEVVRHFTNQEPNHIASIITEIIARDLQVPESKYPDTPPLTQVQICILGFLLRIENSGMENLHLNCLEKLERKLFTDVGIIDLFPLARFYVALCRSKNYIERIRRMCLESFYFMGDLAVPFLFTALKSWLEILPKHDDSNEFPLGKLIVQLVHLKNCTTNGYCLAPLKLFLNKFYGYPSERWKEDEFFNELCTLYLRNPIRSNNLSILIYSKNADSNWIYNKIKTELQPLIEKTNSDNLKATLILVIGNIISQFSPSADNRVIHEVRLWLRELAKGNTASEVVRQSVMLSLKKLPKLRKIKTN